MQHPRGLTLLELLVVLAIMGLATAGVSMALRDGRQAQLTQEAQRLIAVLEAQRAQSRTRGIVMTWQATPEGFVIQTLSPSAPPQALTHYPWLQAHTQAQVLSDSAAMVLGPEPIIPPARLVLSLPPHRVTVATDGLRPFAIQP